VASLGGRFATQRWMTRPTSSPHHTSSAVALVGGGWSVFRYLRKLPAI